MPIQYQAAHIRIGVKRKGGWYGWVGSQSANAAAAAVPGAVQQQIHGDSGGDQDHDAPDSAPIVSPPSASTQHFYSTSPLHCGKLQGCLWTEHDRVVLRGHIPIIPCSTSPR